jgi:hypothetical protein
MLLLGFDSQHKGQTMTATRYDEAAYNRGLLFGRQATQSQLEKLKVFHRGVVSLADTDKPDDTNRIAAGFCSKYEVPYSNHDPFGAFISFVGGVNHDNLPLGDGAIYLLDGK